MPMVFPNLVTDRVHEIIVSTIEIQVTYPDGTPVADKPYELQLSTGGARTGRLDRNGKLREENLPAGAKVTLRLPGIPLLALEGGS